MKKRFVLVTGVVAAIAAAGIAAVKMRASEADGGPPGPRVTLAHPERGTLIEFANAPGEIEPLTKVAISARVSARIVEMPFEEGDTVTAGSPQGGTAASVVVRLDSSDLTAALECARAQRAAKAAQIEVDKCRLGSQRARLDSMATALEKAKTDFDRAVMLRQTQDISQSQLDGSRAEYDGLKADYAAAQYDLEAAEKNIAVLEHHLAAADAEIERARQDLSYTTITSPIDGIVTRVNAKVGELVMTGTMNNAGTVIMEVADLSEMLLVAKVDEADVGKLEVGQAAKVRIHAYPGETFEGEVRSVALTHDVDKNGVKYFKTRILIDPAGRRIYSGLTADVDINTCKHENAVKVPSQAILPCKVEDLPEKIRKDNPNVDSAKTYTTVVYRFVDGKAIVTPVTTGASDLTHTVIVSGLAPEDLVVVGPYKVLESISHDKAVQDADADAPEAATPDAAAQQS